MGFRITLQEFNVETVTKGRQSYEKGVATYTFNGANKQQTLVSFSNPAVFAELKKTPPGTELMVDTTKNNAGYDQWSAVKPVQLDSAPLATKIGPAAAATSPTRTTYETPEERKQKQLYIIKQSSIGSAIESLLPGRKGPLEPNEVLAVAQAYVDWIYNVDELTTNTTAPEA